MYRISYIGPKSLPCGILLSTSFHDDCAEFTATLCFLCLRKSLIHFMTLPLMPWALTFTINLSWGTESKAKAKSIYIQACSQVWIWRGVLFCRKWTFLLAFWEKVDFFVRILGKSGPFWVSFFFRESGLFLLVHCKCSLGKFWKLWLVLFHLVWQVGVLLDIWFVSWYRSKMILGYLLPLLQFSFPHFFLHYKHWS